MALSAFADKTKPPTERDLATVLGKTFPLWNDLQKRIAATYSPLTIDWGYSGKSYGWGLRLKQNKRAILYLTPCKGYFLTSFALGEKAVELAHDSGLPASILKTIDDAPRYAEGRGVRFETRSRQDLRNMAKIAALKMST